MALLGAAALDPLGVNEGAAGAIRDAVLPLQDASGGVRGGQEEANVPGVVGLPAKEAQERLKEAGLEAVLRPRESSEGDVGKVLDQVGPRG